MERWPSGLRRTPGKCVGVKASRGFESLSLRHIFNITFDWCFNFLHKLSVLLGINYEKIYSWLLVIIGPTLLLIFFKDKELKLNLFKLIRYNCQNKANYYASNYWKEKSRIL